MNKIIPVAVIVAIAGAAAGFFGGVQYQKSQAGNNFGRFTNQDAGQHAAGIDGARRLQGDGGGFVSGQITAKDDKSITVTLPSGGSKIIFYSNSTQITKTAEAAAGDLAAGQSVTVQGVANGDGSIVAQGIQLRPAQSSDGAKTMPEPGAPESDQTN
jgi:hypothetical protein